MITYPQDFEVRTGFAQVRAEVQELAVTNTAKQRIAAASFSTALDAIEQNLHLLRELKEYLLFHALSEEYFVDLTELLLILAQPERSLREEDFATLRTALHSVLFLQSIFGEGQEVQNLHRLVTKGEVSDEVRREIDAVLDRTGHLKDNASPELQQIRSQLNAKANRVSRKMEELLARCQRDGYSDANAQVMVRDGRLVLPIAAQHKRKIPSLQLGASSTGQTLFVTPFEVLELENEITELEQREQAEIARILLELTDRCRPYLTPLASCCELLLSTDVLRAKTLYALQVGGSCPILSHERQLVLREAQHPVLLKRMQRVGTAPVPLTLSLTPTQRVVVISGPNAGGKSVALQTVALAVYMLQCGFLPLVKENSEMCLFENLLLDIGDAQSIENDLSTYSSHLKSMRFFTEHANPKTLFLVDEMGSGTEPTAGGAIAEATLNALYQQGAYGIVTTHYACIKNLATRIEGMQNASMRYNLDTLSPLYVLDMGAPGSSYAFEIAHKMGLADSVIREAEVLAGKEYISLEEQLRLAVAERRALDIKTQEVEELQAECAALREKLASEQASIAERRQKILAEARRQAQEMLRDCNRTIEETVRLIKESNADKETTKRVRDELKFYQSFVESEAKTEAKEVKKEVAQTPEITVGATVRVMNGTTTGQVVNVKGKKIVVAVGQVMTTLNLSDVQLVGTGKGAQQATTSPQGRMTRSITPQSSMRQRRLNFSPNLDIRGMRGDEAMDLVRHFLDDAQMFNIPFVSILHGKGTGILRNLLHDYLRHASFVDSFTNTSPTCGDGGITEVYLK